LTFDPLNLIRG